MFFGMKITVGAFQFNCGKNIKSLNINIKINIITLRLTGNMKKH